MIVLDLPMPPSTNGLYRNVPGRGRVKTQRLNTWLRAAGHDINRQPCQRIIGDYSLGIYINPPDRRRRDIDNHIKAISDLLVEHRLVDDDSLARSIRAEWCTHLPKGRALVHISQPSTASETEIQNLQISLQGVKA